MATKVQRKDPRPRCVCCGSHAGPVSAAPLRSFGDGAPRQRDPGPPPPSQPGSQRCGGLSRPQGQSPSGSTYTSLSSWACTRGLMPPGQAPEKAAFPRRR